MLSPEISFSDAARSAARLKEVYLDCIQLWGMDGFAERAAPLKNLIERTARERGTSFLTAVGRTAYDFHNAGRLNDETKLILNGIVFRFYFPTDCVQLNVGPPLDSSMN